MGFALASKGAPLAGLLKKFLHATPAASALTPRSVASTCRLFSTEAPPPPRNVTGYYPEAFALDPSANRGFWLSNEDDDAVEVKALMLEMSKEQMKVSAYKDALLIEWQGVNGSDDDEDPAWFSCRLNLSPATFKVDQTKAVLRDGVLKVTVPKIKDKVVGQCTDIKIDD